MWVSLFYWPGWSSPWHCCPLFLSASAFLKPWERAELSALYMLLAYTSLAWCILIFECGKFVEQLSHLHEVITYNRPNADTDGLHRCAQFDIEICVSYLSQDSDGQRCAWLAQKLGMDITTHAHPLCTHVFTESNGVALSNVVSVIENQLRVSVSRVSPQCLAFSWGTHCCNAMDHCAPLGNDSCTWVLWVQNQDFTYKVTCGNVNQDFCIYGYSVPFEQAH